MVARHRPPYPPEMAAELALHTSLLIGEITEKSGKTDGELERIFGVGTNKDGEADCAEAGKQWRRWKNGGRNLKIQNEQTIKSKALGLEFLHPSWVLDYIITGDNWCRRNSMRPSAEKVERLMREIVVILPSPAADPAPPFGDFLADLYISDCHSCQEGWGEPVEAEERNRVAAALEKTRKKCCRLFGQTATGKIEKRFRKIVQILAFEKIEAEALPCCQRLGTRLTELYKDKT